MGLDINQEMDSVREIALEAGRKIIEIYNRDFSVALKSDQSPLTEADLAAHHIIVDRLSSVYPEIPILSEESAKQVNYEVRKMWDCYWLVDPLDGTREFINRNGQFTVNIAYMDKRCPIAGVVYAPATKQMFWGSATGGAFKAGQNSESIPLTRGQLPFTGRLRVVGSNSHLSQETRDYLDVLRTRYDKLEFVAMGSSLKICLVADGRADLYPRLGPTMEWDTAAAHAVLNAAGGNLYGYETRKQLQYNKENLLNGWFIAAANSSESLPEALSNCSTGSSR